METRIIENQLGIPVTEERNHDWSSQYFWDFLTKPDRPEPRSSATYEETQVKGEIYAKTNSAVNTHFVDNFQESKGAYEETNVEDKKDTHFVNDFEMNTYYGNDFDVKDGTKISHNIELNAYYDNDVEVSDDVKVDHDIESNAYYNTDLEVPDDLKVNHEPVGRQQYEQFVKAIERRDRVKIKEFVESHPKAVSLTLFSKSRTALHYAAYYMDVETVKYLVGRMETKDLLAKDEDGYTALALAAKCDHQHIEEMLGLMLEKNPKLSEIGLPDTIPVIVAAESGAKKATRFLFDYIDTRILMKEYDLVGVRLLTNCIYYKYFDIALDLVRAKPKILLTHDEIYEGYPLQTLAEALNDFPKGTFGNKRAYSGGSLFGCLHLPSGDGVIFDERTNPDEVRQAGEFLQLIYKEVKKYTKQELETAVHKAMISAARNGTVDFIEEMFKANARLIWAKDDKDKGLFLNAIEYRQEEVFCLIYNHSIWKFKDLLLEMPKKESGNGNGNHPEEGNNDNGNGNGNGKGNVEEDEGGNVLHLVAQYDPYANDDPISSFLQMQREIQWFKAVANIVKPHYRFDPNNKGILPNDVFIENHEPLVDVGMKSMKDLATASSVVGGLIVTVMFAALFTAPGGNDQNTGYPLFISEPSFKFFVVFDALSLFSSTTSVLLFLGILTSRYSAKDFDLRLPRKLLSGFAALFFSITTMMLTFCTTLVIMFDGQFLFIAPIVLLAIVPIVFFSRSVCPLLHEIYVSTYRKSIFERHYSEMEKGKRMQRDDMYTYLPDEEDWKMMSYSFTVDRMY